MLQIGISDISKNPSVIDKLHEVVQIVNKKSKKVKGIFIPAELLQPYEKLINDLEYQKFVQRNASLIEEDGEDNTLADGLENEY